MKEGPYESQEGSGDWWLDLDPNNHEWIVADVTKDLADRATTAVNVECILEGVMTLEGPEAQGSLMVGLFEIVAPVDAPASITFRVSCANKARFDRTINLNLKEH